MKHPLMIMMMSLLAVPPLLAAPVAPPGRTDRANLPITIKSNELTTDNKGRTAVFTGKVVARQGDIAIFADKVTVNYGMEKGEVEKIEADGAVRIVQQNSTGTADHAMYDSRQGRIVLTGNPVVTRGKDTLTGDSITYYVDEERSVATSGPARRVEVIIHPPAGKSNAPSR